MTAVHTYPVYMDTVVFKSCKDPFKRILLAETDIGIAVAVFYAYDMVADDSHSGNGETI